MTHDELCERAYRWLLGAGKCNFALMEPGSMANSELPDAIGWSDGLSTVIECKASRQDFYADKKKPHRRWSALGMGVRRYLMIPAALFVEHEGRDYMWRYDCDEPLLWGLLLCHPKQVKVAKESEPFPRFNWQAEMRLLALRARFNYDNDHPSPGGVR